MVDSPGVVRSAGPRRQTRHHGIEPTSAHHLGERLGVCHVAKAHVASIESLADCAWIELPVDPSLWADEAHGLVPSPRQLSTYVLADVPGRASDEHPHERTEISLSLI
jgi:hypothetical protein